MHKSALTVGISLAALWQIGGCAPPLVEVPVDLGGSLGSFDAQAGQTTTSKGTISGIDTPLTVGSGNLEIDPSVITVTPAEGGKRGVSLQETSVLVVTVWVDDVDAIDTVCESGEEYGPFEVTLDEDLVAVSVDPSSVTLTQATIDLINGGEFSVCLEVVSPVDGTVTIESLILNLGL